MADASSDSVSSWPGFVDQVNKTFMLIRDAFGYALPGGVFLGIGLVSGRFTMSQVSILLSPYHMPAWMAFIAIVSACYAVGGVLAAVSYSPFMVAKYVVWMIERHSPKTTPQMPPARAKAPATSSATGMIETVDEYERIGRHEHYEHHELRRISAAPDAKTALAASSGSDPKPAQMQPDPPEGSAAEWLLNNPTEVCPKIVEIRAQQPKLMDTIDRRETLALLAASMTTALLGGWAVFCEWKWSFSSIVLCSGCFVLLQFFTGMPHLRRVEKATKEYYESSKAVPKPDPDLAQLLGDLITSARALLGKMSS